MVFRDQRLLTAAPEARPIYLDAGWDSVFGFYHPPSATVGPHHGVILCGPFGWEDIASYRILRGWAIELAAAGHPTLRVELPGAGDSGGSPRDPERVPAWTAAAAVGSRWLRAESEATRITAIGLTLGGLVAFAAAAQGADIDDLVLWGVPARGRTLVRQLRTFGRLAAAQYDDSSAAHSALTGGYLEVAGFSISAETRLALEALDLTTLSLSDPQRRRVLLLERDGFPVDAALREHLEQMGARVTVAKGDGYGALTLGPQESEPPGEVIATVDSWLSGAGGEPRGRQHSQSDPVQANSHVHLVSAGGSVCETPIAVDQPGGRLFGILSEPVDPPATDRCVVLLNAGAVRRVGPNRMWVEASRRWAAAGVPTLRLDMEGVGDADGDGSRYADTAELYAESLVKPVRATLDALQARGLGGPFVLAGLCAGAFWAFHCLLEDERVESAVMINLRAFFWSHDSLDTLRDAGRVQKLTRASFWLRLLRGGLRWRHVRDTVRWVVMLPVLLRARLARSRAYGDQLDLALDRLRDDGKRAVLIFSGNEPVHEELQASGFASRMARWPNVELIDGPGADHTFRPVWSQQELHELLDHTLLARLLGLPPALDALPLALEATG